MATDITFNEIAKYEPGIIADLLLASYAKVLDRDLREKFRQFDHDAFENLGTIGACTFIATLGTEIIGMASYDPRRAPELGRIGHNCILPENQGKGYGKQQILEIIRRLKSRHIRRIEATTSEHPFFKPACRMYLSCGFAECRRKLKHPHDLHETIYYEMELSK